MKIVTEPNHVPGLQKYCNSIVIDPNSGAIWLYDCAGTFMLLPSSAGFTFDITDGVNTETVINGDTVTFTDGNLIFATISAVDTLTIGIDTTGAVNGDVITLVGGVPVWQATGPDTDDWNLLGNAGTTPGTDFLGTTDALDLYIQTFGGAGGGATGGNGAIHIGQNASTVDGNKITIGVSQSGAGNSDIQIADSRSGSGNQNIGIGAGFSSTSNQSIGIGTSFTVGSSQDITLGTIGASNSVQIKSGIIEFSAGVAGDIEKWPTTAALLNQVLTADGAGQMNWVTPVADDTHVEELFDAVVGAVIVLANVPSGNHPTAVYRNGLRQREGGGRDYTIAGATITLNVAATTEDFAVDYWY